MDTYFRQKVIYSLYKENNQQVSLLFDGRCDISNGFTENKFVKRGLDSVNLIMIGIKSRVNKAFIIQFVLNPESV